MPQRVREMLEEYAALAKGKIELELLDPEPFSPTEDRAVAFGLQGVPLDQSGEQVYFGLAGTNSTDDQQIIAFFQPDRERFLEYDLTKLIHSLANSPKTGGRARHRAADGRRSDGGDAGPPLVPYVVLEQMRQLYDVRLLGTDFDAVPADVERADAGPSAESRAQDALRHRPVRDEGRPCPGLRRSGFGNPGHASEPAQSAGPADRQRSRPLFKAWGLELEPKTVAGDRQAAMRVNAGGASPSQADGLRRLAGADRPISTATISSPPISRSSIWRRPASSSRCPAPRPAFTPLISPPPNSMAIPVDKVTGHARRRRTARRLPAQRPEAGAGRAHHRPGRHRLPDGPPRPRQDKSAERPPRTQGRRADRRCRK